MFPIIGDVVIRTNSYETTVCVNGENDIVRHYGEAKEVNVIRVAKSSYHEYGKVIGNINLAYGNVEIESTVSASKVVIKQLAYTDESGAEQIETPAQDSVSVAVDANAKLNLVAADSMAGDVTIADIVSGAGAENVAKVEKNNSYAAFIGTKGYYNFSMTNAFNKVKEGETIVLMEDLDYYTFSYLSVPKLSSTSKYTLDLGGHTISLGNKWISITAGNVTIINGKIEGPGFVLFSQNCSITLGNNLTICETETGDTSNSAIYASNANVIVDGAKIIGDNAHGISVVSNTALTVKSGEISSNKQSAISGNGTQGKGNTVISIEGGYTHSDDIAIYNPQIGSLNIFGGTIEGYSAICIKSGSLNISGGTIKGTGEKKNYQYKGNGAKATGDAIVIDACEYPGGNPTVHVINGANITSVNADPITIYLHDAKDDGQTPSANITTTIAYKTWVITLEGTTYTATCGEESYTYEKK